jgi:hypothetical protein
MKTSVIGKLNLIRRDYMEDIDSDSFPSAVTCRVAVYDILGCTPDKVRVIISTQRFRGSHVATLTCSDEARLSPQCCKKTEMFRVQYIRPAVRAALTRIGVSTGSKFYWKIEEVKETQK